MANYTNVTDTLLPEIQTDIGAGLVDVFGSSLLLGVVGLIVIGALGYKMNLDVDTQVLSFVTMIFILLDNVLLTAEWLFWVMMLPLGVYAGVIFSRIIKK